MTFRSRVFLVLVLAALVPLLVLAVGIRREMTQRVSAEYVRRVEALADVVRGDLARERAGVDRRVQALVDQLETDNRFRVAILQPGEERRYLLDVSGELMRLGGLDVLQVQDDEGRILSSGQFRNDFDRLDPALPHAVLPAGTTPVVAQFRTAQETFLALVASDTLTIGGRRLTVTGGTRFDEGMLRRMTRDPGLAVSLVTADTVITPDTATGRLLATSDQPANAVVARIPVVWVPGGGDGGDAAVVITQEVAGLVELRRGVDRWVLAVGGASLLLVLVAGLWLSARVTRPIRDLAHATERIDLERLDADLPEDRGDEVGQLARVLHEMTARLRAGTTRLREAERRAATGDLARQVNHDIKNGLVPLRNVFRHLQDTAMNEPETMAQILVERGRTIQSSLEYLDNLARTYARLSPGREGADCDLTALADTIAADSRAAGRPLEVEAASRVVVPADPLVLRRILDNLVGNAFDSLENGTGSVTLRVEGWSGGEGPMARIAVRDTGTGMTREELDRAFTDYHTTKAGGTGLGLSVVRRLVADLNGSLSVRTAPGEGTTVTIELPASADSGANA